MSTKPPSDNSQPETNSVTEVTEAPVRRLTDRASARARLLASKAPPFKLIAFNGDEMAIQMPTAGQKGDIQKAAIKIDAKGKIDVDGTAKRMAALIACVYTVGPDGKPEVPIFDDADRPVLLKQPSGPNSVLEVVGTQVEEFIGDLPSADELDAKKKS